MFEQQIPIEAIASSVKTN